MAAGKDKLGRPLVVVTGLGVVTSLGAGKTDNWAKLTAGESGIKTITRFPTDGLKTRIAGTIDYLPPQPCAAALTESFAELAAEEAIAQSALGEAGQFPGPLFLAVPPIEMEWPQRLEDRREVRRQRQSHLCRHAAGKRAISRISSALSVRLGCRQSGREVWHTRFADFAIDCLRLRRNCNPAWC